MAKRTPAVAASPGAIELVIRLCEQERPEVAWHVLEMHFSKAGQELIAAGALVETTPSKSIMIPVDNDDEPVEFEWDPEFQVYAAFHPVMGWVTAGPNARRRYRLDLEWLLSILADQLGVPASARTTPLVPNLLWDLGDAWFGRRKATILFARRLGDETTFDSMCDALTRRVGRPPGVVLTTTSRPFSRHLTVPGRHSVLSMRECLRGDVPGLAVDADIISGVLNGLRPQRPGQLIAPSPDFRIVRALGQTFHFKGDKQRSIIEYMHGKWLDGHGRVSTAEVIADLDLPAKARVRDLFKKHPAWNVLLTEKAGSVRFLV